MEPLIITRRMEEILRTVHFYRFVTALDVTHLLFSPGSKVYVRDLLTTLAGREDGRENYYLYRFQLPHIKTGNTERVYTLGSRGRDFLANEAGLPVTWYYRPEKVKHFNYGHVLHNLILTRFLVSAHSWCAKQPDYNLTQTRICYELSKTSVVLREKGREDVVNVIPDAWLMFEKLQNGTHDQWLPVLFEIDRGTEYQQKFKEHVRSRLEFIRSGEYAKLFATKAVKIAYVTTGDTKEYQETRRRTMCKWTQEVLVDLHKENWAGIFRFTSILLGEIYETSLFEHPVWFRPDSDIPVNLFDS
jgi:hypothetical protein